MYDFPGVDVSVSPPIPLTVGQPATLNCVNVPGVAELIEWRTRDGVVLSRDISAMILEYYIPLVNDSVSLHRNEFTCYITRANSGVFNQTLSLVVSGMLYFLITISISLITYIWILGR